jgi:type IV pilus assembly protein PilW
MLGLHGIGAYQAREPQGALPVSRGFSLTEILIAMAIGSLLLAGMTNTFITQRRIYASREQVVEAQENVRWGLDAMAREIAMAGCDPTGTSGAGINAASSAALQFTMDLNGDGDTDDVNEQVTYALYDADGDGHQGLGRDTGGGFQLVAENIANLSFLYTLADGTSTPNPADPGQIREIRVSLTGKTARPDVQYAPNGGYRTRTLTMAIQIRNMRL